MSVKDVRRWSLLAVVGVAAAALMVPTAAGAQVPDCPCTVFAPSDAPGGEALQDQPLEVGMKFRSSEDGFITALRFYKHSNNTGRHVGHLWSAGGQQLAEIEFTGESASGWQVEQLPIPIAITEDTTYVVSYHSGEGRYSRTPGYFSGDVGEGPLQAPALVNGVYHYGQSAFPDQTWNATNYWVDVTFERTVPADNRPPRVSAVTPADGARDVELTTKVEVSFDEPIDEDTITTANFSLRDSDDDSVAAAVTYDAVTRTATLTPTAELAYVQRYTATVKGGGGGVADAAGNPLAADRSWSLTTPAACPCTVFGPTDTPQGNATGDQPLELGMKMWSSEDGFISALRFYKPPGDTGHHVGHLWSSSGNELAEVEFTNETSSGWQVEQLPIPIAITKNTTYVVSYHSGSGQYARTVDYFSSDAGEGPLRAPALGNGVYRYGPSSFPDVTFNATNYWVDATFERTRPADTRAPTVSSFTPAQGASDIDVTAEITATFDEQVDPLTVNADAFVLEDDAGNGVAGAVSYDESARQASFTLSAPLAHGTTYRATIKGGSAGAADLAGNRIAADRSWTFSTPAQCPCTIFAPTDAPASAEAVQDQTLEVGVKFRSREDGIITALRFYKQSNNTGTHVGHLWSAEGQLLATVPFVNETSSGWQQADLPEPIAITKDTIYVASYHSSSGYFAMDRGGLSDGRDRPPLLAPAAGLVGGNGVYRYGLSAFPDETFDATNYWVDVEFERVVRPTSVSPPRISGGGQVGERLAATPGNWQAGAPLEYSYQWRRCNADGGSCEDIAGANRRHYEVTVDDLRHTLRVRVVAASGDASSSAVSDAVPAAVDPPVSVNRPGIAGAALVGHPVAGSDGEWRSHDPDLALSRQWLTCDAQGEDCADIAGATGDSYVSTSGDVGQRLRLRVTATNASGSTSSVSEPTEPVAMPALVNTIAPALREIPSESGTALTVQPGAWTGNGPISYRHRWQRCDADGERCAPLGAGPRHELGASDVGATLRALVTATGADGSASAQTPATPVVEAEAPVTEDAPTISGTAAEGELLVAQDGTWYGTGPLTLDYQWQRCDEAGESCANVADATEPVYRVGAPDVDSRLRVVVTAQNGSGTDVAASAAGTSVVAVPELPALPTLAQGSAVTLSGDPRVGELLTVDEGDWEGAGPLDFTYAWERCDAALACVTIAGAGGPSYRLVSDDVGEFVRVLITVSDSQGTGFATADTSQSVRSTLGPASDDPPYVSGDAREGAQLTAATGAWTVTSPVEHTYQWQSCDLEEDECGAIEGANEPTYAPGPDDVGFALRVAVTAIDTEGSTTALSPLTAVVSAVSPHLLEAPSIDGVARRGAVLTASAGEWDGITPMTYAYQWQRCDADGESCAEISGANGDEYSLAEGDIGATLRVVVTAANSVGSTTETSEPTAAIASSDAPEPVEGPVVTGTPEVGEELSAAPGGWTGPGPITYAYQWEACEDGDCVALDGAEESSYVATGDDVGLGVRVRVIATNAVGSVAAASEVTEPVAPTYDPDVALEPLRNESPPTVSGQPQQGEPLTAEPGTWSERSVLSFDYQWRVCDADGGACANVDGASDAIYVPGSDDVGKRLRVVVTATDGSATSRAVSSASPAIGIAAPENVVVPSVAGNAIDGGTLSADGGTWTSEVELSYQWQRCDADGEECTGVLGATEPELTLTSNDVGATHRVAVTAINDGGTATAVSEPGPVVSPAPPASQFPPSLLGQAMEGGRLTSDTGSWSGTPELSFSYQWQRCNAVGQQCANLAGATTAEYAVTTPDVGLRLRARVTASNAAGTAVATSFTSGTVVVAMPPQALYPPTIGGEANDGQVLTGYYGYWSGLEPMTYAHQWRSCDSDGEACEDIPGATSGVLTLGGAELGGTVRLEVTATNAVGSVAAVSDPTDVIGSGPPELDWEPWFSELPHPGETVTAEPGGWSGSAPIDHGYQWQICDTEELGCEDIPGATEASFAVGEELLGRYLRVAVSASNGHGTETAWSYPELVDWPFVFENTEAPTVSGPPIRGHELAAEIGTWSAEPDDGFYQWQRCDAEGTGCTDIPGADGATYTLVDADLGMRLRVAVTAWPWFEHERVTAVSAPSAVVEVIGNLVPPALAGDPVAGADVYLNDLGEWEGDFENWSVQWQRCDADAEECVDIDSHESWHVATVADVGFRLRALVTIRTDQGEATVATEASEPVRSAERPRNLTRPAIAGIVEVGEELVAQSGEWSGTYPAYDRQWQRCDASGGDCDDIAGAVGYEYRLTRADEGATLRVLVTATNAWGSVSVESEPTGPAGPPPPFANISPPELAYAWDDPEYDLSFEADIGAWSGVPDVVEQWQRCDPLTADPVTGDIECVDIPGATDPKGRYTPGVDDLGFKLRLKETATTPNESVTLYTEPSAEFVTAQVKVFDEAFDGVPVIGQTITARGRAESLAPVPTSLTYGFYRSRPGEPLELLQDGDSPEYTLTAADAGARIEIHVTAHAWRIDEADTFASHTRVVTTPAVEPPPTNDTTPTIAGDTVAGATLEADAGTWHGGAGSLTYSHQWQRCDAAGEGCADIDGATDPAYRLTGADVSARIRVRVTAASGSATGTATSPATDQVTAATAPANTAPPAITTAPVERLTVTADPGEWDGSDPIEHRYQWQACWETVGDEPLECEDVEDATKPTFVPGDAEVGMQLRVQVTAENGGGTATAQSALSEIVQPAPPPQNVELPSLTLLGPAAVGSHLTTNGGEWQNADDSDLSFNWQRCDATGSNCSDIPDADAADYELAIDDVGSRLRIEVIAETISGDSVAASELSPPIAEWAPTALERLVLVNEARDRVLTVGRDGTDARVVADCQTLPIPPGLNGTNCAFYKPLISGNGALITVQYRIYTWSGPQHRVMVMNHDGTGARDLGEGTAPTWTPDPSELLISRATDDAEGSPAHIYRIEVDGSDAGEGEPVTSGDRIDSSPSLSPDGTMLTFTGKRSGDETFGLYVSIEGGEPVRLDLEGKVLDAQYPVFSQDSNEIYFTAQRATKSAPAESRPQTWAVGIDGSNLRMLTVGDRPYPGPVSPDADGSLFMVQSTFEACPGEIACWHPDWDYYRSSRIWRMRVLESGLLAAVGSLMWQGRLEGGERDLSAPRRFLSDDDDIRRKVMERIRGGQGLSDLEGWMGSEKTLERGAYKSALQTAAKAIRHIVTRAGVLGLIAEIALSDGDLDCEPGPFNRDAREIFARAGWLLERVAGVDIGYHADLIYELNVRHSWRDWRGVLPDMREFRARARQLADDVGDKCEADYHAAWEIARKLVVALKRADQRLASLHREDAKRYALRIEARGDRLGGITCAEAKRLKPRAGKKKRNHVVYMAPPREHDDVRYVGISRSLWTRCANYRRDPNKRYRADQLETLWVSPLSWEEARNVEEALIAHFGVEDELRNRWDEKFLSETGQIQPDNRRHEWPDDKDYCDHLLRGQSILRAHGYDPPLGSAHFTRQRSCFGLGTPWNLP